MILLKTLFSKVALVVVAACTERLANGLVEDFGGHGLFKGVNFSAKNVLKKVTRRGTTGRDDGQGRRGGTTGDETATHWRLRCLGRPSW